MCFALETTRLIGLLILQIVIPLAASASKRVTVGAARGAHFKISDAGPGGHMPLVYHAAVWKRLTLKWLVPSYSNLQIDSPFRVMTGEEFDASLICGKNSVVYLVP